jgi:hypothetical protein
MLAKVKNGKRKCNVRKRVKINTCTPGWGVQVLFGYSYAKRAANRP